MSEPCFEKPSHPASWYTGFCVGLGRVMKELHVGYEPLLRILAEEGIPIVRVPAGKYDWCFIHREYLSALKIKHASRPPATDE